MKKTNTTAEKTATKPKAEKTAATVATQRALKNPNPEQKPVKRVQIPASNPVTAMNVSERDSLTAADRAVGIIMPQMV